MHCRQDIRLNEAYRTLTGNLTGNRKKELLAAQRLWIRYRDANCKVYAYPDGGTASAVHAASCELEMTAQRAKELENLFIA
ncbi:lysozyme inhibitor LprI family protein [Halopseudomonas pelagia]|uniref:lysozyme inhibitor LprI family protein n=1 Tax=Halopseudomonas pelagia TaxID=553151 RepID=UPI0012688676